MKIERLFDIIDNQLTTNPKEDAFATKYNGVWKKESTQSFLNKVNAISRGLLKMGFKPEDKVAIITANNRTEWHIIDYGIQQIGAVSVPIYPTISQEDTIFVLNNSESKICFVSDEALYNKIKSIKGQVPNLVGIYTFDEVKNTPNWNEILDLGQDSSTQYEVDSIKDIIKSEDIATIIYTSGTTGLPKGVVLTHKNIVSNVLDTKYILDNVAQNEIRILSFLPICHIFERMVVYMYQYKCYSIYFAENLEKIGDNIREVKPNFFTTVPRLLEKVYDKIYEKGTQSGLIKRNIFLWALKQIENKDINQTPNLAQKIADKLVFSKWREALGGNLIAIISGSASLSTKLNGLFNNAGIKVLEGYGLTETSPVISANSLDKNGIVVGAVGKVHKSIDLKIAEDGEILVKGPSIFSYYYKNPEQTKEAFTEDKYFKTGDIGTIKDGFLYITDRKKEMFKTSGGKYVAPQKIELMLKQSSFIEQAMVVGDGEKMPCAIIQIQYEHVKNWIKIKKYDIELDNKSLSENDTVKQRIIKEVNKINKNLGNWEQIKKIELIPNIWSIDGGELTPTLKLKRKYIKEKYINYYNKLYKD